MRPIKECVKLFALGLGLLFFINGCAPDAAALEATVVAQAGENIVQTIAVQPTFTHQPTYTAEPTYTTQPTHTAEPTLTDELTLTPEATYTPEPTYTSEPTYTPLPTNTPIPLPTSPPTPTLPPSAQFTEEGVELTKYYMNRFPGAYFSCTIYTSSGCLNPNHSVDCVGFVYDFNAIIARQNLAPQNAEEPIRTAAAIYSATVQDFIAVMSPQVTYCQEQLALGRDSIASQEIGEKNIPRQIELLAQMDQVIQILRQVEEGNA